MRLMFCPLVAFWYLFRIDLDLFILRTFIAYTLHNVPQEAHISSFLNTLLRGVEVVSWLEI